MNNKELFLNGYIERIANKFELSKDLAFEILSLAAILDLSFDEVYNTVSTIVNKSGSHDGGLDGIYLEEDENTLHIFQVKASGSIKENELAKFVDDFHSLFIYGNTINKPLNAKVTAELEKYITLTKSGRVVDTKLYFIFKGDKTKQNEPLINRYLQENSNLQVFDSDDLYEQIDSLVAEGKKRKSIDFSFEAERSNISLRHDPQALISFYIQNVKAVNFRLSALKLCELIDKEKQINKHISGLFSDNIRGFLNYKNRTNKNIQSTLHSNYAEYFPFLNNGITIIAEKVNIPTIMQAGSYPIEVINPIIVNGLQTTKVIYDVYLTKKSLLDNVYVLVRLYETTNSDLISKITDATNTQSLINHRDKISNTAFNKHTKEVFANAGIGYLTKRGETFDNKLSIASEKSVHSETVLKFWYATFYQKPETAKNAKEIVFEMLFDAAHSECKEDVRLNELFKGDKNSPLYQQLLDAFLIYDFVTKKRKDTEYQDDFILFSDELMAYGVYKLLSESGRFIFDKSKLEVVYQKVYDAISVCICKEKDSKKNKRTYSHNTFFKSKISRDRLNEELNLNEDLFSIF